MKELPALSKSSGLSLDYLLALGSVKHYLERVQEFYKEKDLPTRWINLAERSLLHRKINTYLEIYSPSEYLGVMTEQNKRHIEDLDTIVAKINILREKSDAARVLRDIESEDFKLLSKLYTEAKEIIIYGKKKR